MSPARSELGTPTALLHPASGSAAPQGRTRRHLRWAAERWLPLTALAIAAPLVVITALGTLHWPGRPFPGFFLMGNAVVPTVGLPSWTGMRERVPFHSRVIAVDDKPVGASRDVYRYAASMPVGTVVRYTLSKGGQTLSRAVPTMRFGVRDYWLTVGLYVLFGLLSIATGVGVRLLQPHGQATLAFMMQGVITGVFALTGTALYHPEQWWLSGLHFLTQAAFPAAFVHLGLVFPVPRRFVARRPLWLAVPYVIAALLTGWVFVTFYGSPPRTTALYATYLYSAISIAVLVGLAGFTYRENRTPNVRPQLNLVIPGLVLGTAVALVGFLNTARSGGDFPMNFIAIPSALFYLSVGYAIARRGLFDIDALVKQAAVYGTLTLVITGAYAGSLVLLGVLVPPQVVRSSLPFNIAFVVLVAFLFDPLRERVQHSIDRIFYRGRLDYRRTVSQVTTALTSLLDMEEILSRVGSTVAEGLQLRSLAIVLWLAESTQEWRYNPKTRHMEASTRVPYDALHRQLGVSPHRPWHVPEADDEVPTGFSADGANPEQSESALRAKIEGPISKHAGQVAAAAGVFEHVGAARREMATLGATFLLPLTLGTKVIGCFALGPRRSGRVFSREDLELLSTLAQQSAIAIQNAQSYRVLKTLNRELEEKVHARTAELETSNAQLARAYRDLKNAQAQLVHTEKMASLGQLTAGVAHEINNPVSFIVGNVEPLRRHLDSLRSLALRHSDAALEAEVERVSEVLDVIARGAERTAAIVNDLRTFSRVGEAAPKPMDLNEGIEVSLRLLRPRWAGRLDIHRTYGALPRVEAVPGQMNQVFMNILANACDAIDNTGNIWVETASEGSLVKVTIRDDGSGIPRDQLHRIFDPFFTTKPIGKGTGLGLAISQRIVTDHGGTTHVESAPGKGTTFTVVLPIQQNGPDRKARPDCPGEGG